MLVVVMFNKLNIYSYMENYLKEKLDKILKEKGVTNIMKLDYTIPYSGKDTFLGRKVLYPKDIDKFRKVVINLDFF